MSFGLLNNERNCAKLASKNVSSDWRDYTEGDRNDSEEKITCRLLNYLSHRPCFMVWRLNGFSLYYIHQIVSVADSNTVPCNTFVSLTERTNKRRRVILGFTRFLSFPHSSRSSFRQSNKATIKHIDVDFLNMFGRAFTPDRKRLVNKSDHSRRTGEKNTKDACCSRVISQGIGTSRRKSKDYKAGTYPST